jgi:uncharacterized membrane protein YqjE
MLGPARELAHALLSFAETRTRLAATELEEQALRITEIVLWLAIALFFLGLALVFSALVVVLLFWDSNRLLATSLIAGLFIGVGIVAGVVAWLRMRERPKFLAATLAELHRDKERLG